MDELITMSKREISRLEVMQRLKEKRLSQKEAAQLMGISVRQVKRLWRAYQKGGAKGIVHQRRGKASNHRLDASITQQALDLIKERYEDFGPTLAHEKLVEVHGLALSRESVRRIMIEEAIWKPNRVHPRTVHPLRERRACFGELVQIDGSEHAWFEERGPVCTLLVFIDDATGKLLELWFVTAESFFAYCEASRHYFERNGKPVAFYSDKHGVFHVNAAQPIGSGNGMTQFGRAMEELDIQIICANSPQAKGRVERANQTLQDRLVKDLRLRGISDIDTANTFLPEFREDFNRRFAAEPRSQHDAHRPLLKSENLDRIFTHQKIAYLSKNLTVQFEKVIYQIQSDRPGYALHNAQVVICENAKGEVSIHYKDKPLLYTTFKKLPHQAETVETKNINRTLQTFKSPAPDHPWRTYGQHLNGVPIPEASSHGSD